MSFLSFTMDVTTVIILLQIKYIWKKPVQKSSTGVKKKKKIDYQKNCYINRFKRSFYCDLWLKVH